MKNGMLRYIALCLVLALALGLSACTGATQVSGEEAPSEGSPDTQTVENAEAGAEITVTASGTVRVVPDMASVSFGVTNQNETAEEAQKENSEAVKNVIDVLTERGIEEKDIRTEYYSLYPQYDYYSGNPQISGYSVTTTLSVQGQSVDELGQLLSACVAAGITNVDNVNLLCSSYDDAYQQALAKGVDAAREKGEALAAAAGKKLGEVKRITEGWQDTSARYAMRVESETGAGDMEDAAASIQPGETEIAANVTVTFGVQE